MSITWWTPTADMRSAHRAMDRLIEQFFGEHPVETNSAGAPTYYLPVDVFESDDAYTLVASVPGFRKDQVDVTFDDGILSIKAKADETHAAPGRWLRQERPYGSFVRRLEVPAQVETAKISAAFDNGELTVTIPKTAKPQPVKIQIGGSHKETAKASS